MNKTTKKLAFSLIFAYLVYYFFQLFSFTHNYPRGDDYVHLSFLKNHTSSPFLQNLKDSFSQYYEQRVFVARFIYIYSYKIFSIFSLSATMIVGNTLYLGIIYIVFCSFFRFSKYNVFAFAIVAVLLLNTWFAENALWSFGVLQYQTSLLFSVLALYFCFVNRNLFGGIIFSWLATFCVGSGHFIVPIITLGFLINYRHDLKKAVYYFLTNLPALVLFYWKYEFLNGFFNSDISSYIAGFFTFLGGRWAFEIANSYFLSVIIGLIIFLVFIYCTIHLVISFNRKIKTENRENDIKRFLFGICSTIFLVALSASVNRVVFNKIDNVLYGRYQIFVGLLILSIFSFLYFTLQENIRKYVIGVFMGLSIYFIGSLFLVQKNNFEHYFTNQVCMNTSFNVKTNKFNTLATNWLEQDTSLFVREKYLINEPFSKGLMEALKYSENKPSQIIKSFSFKISTNNVHLIEKQAYKYYQITLENGIIKSQYKQQFDGLYIYFENESFDAFLLPLFQKGGEIKSDELYPLHYSDGNYKLKIIAVFKGKFSVYNTNYTMNKKGLNIEITN